MNALSYSVGIIIVNYKTASLTLQAVKSLEPELREFRNAHVLILDGNSQDGSVEFLQEQIQATSLSDLVTLLPLGVNKGFSYANNEGVKYHLVHSDCEYLWLVNPDVIARPGSLGRLVEFLDSNQDVGIVGSRLENEDGSTQFAARRFPGIISEIESNSRFRLTSKALERWRIVCNESDSSHECDWLPGASLMVRRQVFLQVGLLDDNYFMYFEEVDFCRRAKLQGFKICYVPSSALIHLVGQASGVVLDSSIKPSRRLPKYWFDSRSRYYRRYHGTAGLTAANVAFVLGIAVHRMLCMLRWSKHRDPPMLLRDFLSHALLSPAVKQ